MTEAGLYKPAGNPPSWDPSTPDQTTYQQTIHAQGIGLRDRCIPLFKSSDSHYLRKLSDAIALCQPTLWIHVDPETGATRPRRSRCKKVFCDSCAYSRRYTKARILQAYIAKMKNPVHLVFAAKSVNESLAGQMTHSRDCFRLVRRAKFWKANFTGGVYTLEATMNEDTVLWHPHVHTAVDAPDIDPKVIMQEQNPIRNELIGLYKMASFDSWYTWLRPIVDSWAAAWDIAQYVGKPVQADKLSDDQLKEYALAVQRMHMIEPYGNLRGLAKDEPDEEETKPLDGRDFGIDNLIWLADHAIGCAAEFLTLYVQCNPRDRRYVRRRLPDLEIPLTVRENYLDNCHPGHKKNVPPAVHGMQEQQRDLLMPELNRVALRLLDEQNIGLHEQARPVLEKKPDPVWKSPFAPRTSAA